MKIHPPNRRNLNLIHVVVSSAVVILIGVSSQLYAQTTTAPLAQLTGPAALEEYVHRSDASYQWNVISESTQANGTHLAVLEFVSQTWRTSAEVDKPEWRHWLTIAYPENVKSDIGFLFISGGSNKKAAPSKPEGMIRKIAEATGTAVAELKMVPNQPLIFHNDGQPRTEDDLIGYTWDQYIKTGDPNWPARNPMIKSAVRAMDTITAFMKTKQQDVDQFVVGGASKRGWTTWLTGALDDRVVGIVPIVIDVLNADVSMRHHFAAYGFWAPSINNYVQHKIMERMDHDRLKELYQMVDPYSYLDRLTMPKLILNASGDQFFLPDSSQFYWNELEGPKYLRYVPNADHGLDDTDAIESLICFYSNLVNDRQQPDFDWSFQADNSIRIVTRTKPKEVRLWQATNPIARDFRLETFGPQFTSSVLPTNEPGVYVANVSAPPNGWTAYFVELTFDVGMPIPMKLTSGVRVIPDILPFADKDPNAPGTVTIICTAPDEAAADGILDKLTEKATGAAQSEWENLQTNRIGAQIFINYKPTESDAVATAEKLTEKLAEQGCHSFQYQLEAGATITYPPGKVR